EGWVDQWSARLGRLHRRACREAIDERVGAEDLAGAVQVARRWTDVDPLDDEAQHRLIELLALSGDRSEALRQYDRYERLVREELELEPLDETKELVEQIRAGAFNGNGALATPAPAAPPQAATREDTEAGVNASEPAAPMQGASPAREPTPTPPTRAPAPGFVSRTLSELRRRHVIGWTLAYLATALGTFEAVQNLASAYGWSPSITRELPVLLGFGAVAAIVLAWYHGAAGWQRVTPAEAGILAILAVGGFTFATVTGEGRANPSRAASGRLDLSRIAVLPFADLSDRGNLGPLAGQITDALIDRLAQVPVLHVLPRAATTPFAAGTTPFDSIVKSLNAGAIVEGSVKDGGGEYQVKVQLIDVASAEHMISQTFTTPTDQDDAANSIGQSAVHALLNTLDAELVRRARRARASNEEAWKLFERARNVENVEVGPRKPIWDDDPNAALRLLDQADSLLARTEQLDPHWLDPIVERANIATTRAKKTAKIGVNYQPGATRQAIDFLDRALARDPEYVPALSARGLLRYHLAENRPVSEADTLYNLAEADLRHAVRIDTLQAEAWYTLADIDHRNNALNAAAADAVRALRADVFQKNTPAYTFSVFFQYFSLEERQGAAYWCNRLESSTEPTAPSYARYCRVFMISAMRGVAPDVNLAWKLAPGMNPREPGYGEIFVAKTLARAGLADSARAVLRRAAPPPSDSTPIWAPYDAAHALLMLGDREKALQYLHVYARLKPAATRSLATDWLFRPLWSDPEYQAIAGMNPRG
ncbi:MAG TPA: BTAD domain-containing putative transcriptional regulator, partial [Longimicrobiales bacterium]|nr:BTAD domain-containing putative transcriptional regulator [Longimicrobiales bacterium]